MKNAIYVSVFVMGMLAVQVGMDQNAIAQDDPGPLDVAAVSIARDFLADGAAMVNRGDADGVAGQFIESGELVLKTIHPDREPEVQIIRGSNNLREWFKVTQGLITAKVTNKIEYARFVAADVVHVTGTMEILSEDGKMTRLSFSQVRSLDEGVWKIVTHQIMFAGT